MKEHIVGLIALAMFVLGLAFLPDVCKLMLEVWSWTN